MAKTIYSLNTELTADKRFSSFSEDVVGTGTTFRVQSILGFQNLDTSSGQIVMIGEVGNERTEILRTSNSTAPSAAYKEITLRDPMAFDHPQDTKVYIIDWNRVDVQWSASSTGSKSTLFAYPRQILPDLKETPVIDTSQTTGFYFTRFNESIGNTNSDWSDPIPYAGYDDNMVFSIKQRALDLLGAKVDGDVITHQFLNDCLWEARREYHNENGKRPFRKNFNKVIGTALTGSFRIECPTDLENPNNAENVYGVRIGANANMNYYGKKEWDFDYRNKPHSTLDVPYTRNTSTSIWLANGKDFTQSGSIYVEGTLIGYSKVSGSNNSLTITSHGGWSASAGSDVFQNVSDGLPDRFTVWADVQGSAYVYFNLPIATAYINQNIFMDYYRTVVQMNSDADVLDEPQFDMFVHYLAYRIKQRKARGDLPVVRSRTGQATIADSEFQKWLEMKNSALQGEYGGMEIRIAPAIEHLMIPNDSSSGFLR